MSRTAILRSARDFALNVPPDKNVFAPGPMFLNRTPWEARTLSHSFVACLLEDAAQLGPKDLVDRFGRANPRASDYHAAVTFGEQLDHVPLVSRIRLGDLIAIRSCVREGGQGIDHCAIVSALPTPAGQVLIEGRVFPRYLVGVIDATDKPHGPTDTRAIRNHVGVGSGTMVIFTNATGFVAGFAWSPAEEPVLNVDGINDLVIGSWRLPAI